MRRIGASLAAATLLLAAPIGTQRPSVGVLVDELEAAHEEVALAAADALAGGNERARLEVVRSTYQRVRADSLTAALALGLARGYPDSSSRSLARRRRRASVPPTAAPSLPPSRARRTSSTCRPWRRRSAPA